MTEAHFQDVSVTELANVEGGFIEAVVIGLGLAALYGVGMVIGTELAQAEYGPKGTLKGLHR